MSRIAVSTKRIPTSAALRWLRLSRFERVYELRDEIGAAAGRHRHDETDRFVGEGLRVRRGEWKSAGKRGKQKAELQAELQTEFLMKSVQIA